MDAEKPPSSSNPGEGMHTSQVNYGYEPHTGVVPAYNATGHYTATTTVVTIVEDNAIKDHILWSIFSTLYMNCCCLGFVALVYSVKSRDRKFLGDRVGAKSYSDTARSLNIATITITSLWFILMIILMATGVWTVNYVNTRT
ncbi:Interferon-induced transmembrane protein 3 [Aquarana catesbeiana]|uniref:Interferon-induced transmembrane protein 3 n=1 Tax=Aquarana catesbeiana TaxID=8400 RepID=A0A2G9SCL0_AQUCT|nr:Interferon-induced transmembrane protein 3 [Aquarana catesbeiana]